jgi:hypothetical protein
MQTRFEIYYLIRTVTGPIAETRGVPLWFFISGIVLLLLALVSALLVLPEKADKTGRNKR